MSEPITNAGSVQTDTEARPLITFALFAYKQAQFIREAVEGAFSQTYEPLEIVLSDDCSPDNTFVIMQEMAAAYKGPHKIILNRNEKNLGLAEHINRVVEISKGEWIVTAAGDDISLSNRVADSCQVVEKYGEVGGVFGRFHSFRGEFRDNGQWGPSHAMDGLVISGSNTAWIDRFERGESFGTPGCVAMWNRKLFDQFGPIPNGVIAEDVVLGNRAFFSGMGVGFTAAHMVLYRCHDANACAGKNKSVFFRKALFSSAVSHHELLNFRRNCPEIYTDKDWNRIIGLIEASIFQTIVSARRNELGWVRSALILIVGVRHEKLKSKLRFIKGLLK